MDLEALAVQQEKEQRLLDGQVVDRGDGLLVDIRQSFVTTGDPGHPLYGARGTDVTVLASIARGIGTGGTPMAGIEWHRFKRSLKGIMHAHCGAPVYDGEGTWWFEHNGAPSREDNYVVACGALPTDIDELRRELRLLASAWSQDSVALLVGVPEFVTP